MDSQNTITDQDTGKKRINTKDQYYTNPHLATVCVAKILELHPTLNQANHLWLEPSAGRGVFIEAAKSHNITNIKAYDIDPKHPDVTQADYLVSLEQSIQGDQSPTVVFGNPPFGRQGSLAKKFIKKAAAQAPQIIAFILPLSFVKPSMYNVFPLNYHMEYSAQVPPNSFQVNTQPYDVPCVYQIWARKSTHRPAAPPAAPQGFKYVAQSAPHNLIIRRVGVYAGRAFLKPGPAEAAEAAATYSPQTHYYIALNPLLSHKAATAAQSLNAHTFPTNTTGPRSLSKGEVAEVLNKLLLQPLP
jgi:predicted RNA methylase